MTINKNNIVLRFQNQDLDITAISLACELFHKFKIIDSQLWELDIELSIPYQINDVAGDLTLKYNPRNVYLLNLHSSPDPICDVLRGRFKFYFRVTQNKTFHYHPIQLILRDHNQNQNQLYVDDAVVDNICHLCDQANHKIDHTTNINTMTHRNNSVARIQINKIKNDAIHREPTSSQSSISSHDVVLPNTNIPLHDFYSNPQTLNNIQDIPVNPSLDVDQQVVSENRAQELYKNVARIVNDIINYLDFFVNSR